MSQARVVFVDDEPNILAGLRRMLWSQREVWDMRFATGGREALEMLDEQPADILVTDMRMPGMDGAQLLAEVRTRHPGTARMVLSGHAELESILAAIGPTQQYLAKPCDAPGLVAAIDGVLAVRSLMEDERIRGIVGEVETLPKPPAVYDEMVAVTAEPECRISDIAAVVERDVATSAEVLKLVNSAFFFLPRHVDSVEQAVSLLGIETIQALALAGAVFRPGPRLPYGFDLEGLRWHGLSTGSLAQRLALAEGWTRAEVSHTLLAGLLHEVGLLVLASRVDGGWDRLAAGLAEVGGDPMSRALSRPALERDAFGCTVGEAGAYLLGLWGFAQPVVHAIAAQPAQTQPQASPMAQIVTFAARRSADPRVPVQPWGGYVHGERAAHWNAVGDEWVETTDEVDPAALA